MLCIPLLAALTKSVAFSTVSLYVGTSDFSMLSSAFLAILAEFLRFDIFLYVAM